MTVHNHDPDTAAPAEVKPAMPNRQRRLLPVRILGTLISAVLVGLGLLSIWTEHYFGRTSKPRFAEIVLDGKPAVMMGLGLVVFGLFPLAFWANSGKHAALWASVCLIIGIIVMVFGTRYFA